MRLEHFDKFVESLKEMVSEKNRLSEKTRLFRSWVGDYSSDILNFINQHEEVGKAFQQENAPGQYRQFNIFDHPSFIGVSSQDPSKISYLTWNAIVKHNLLRVKFRSKESEDVTIWKHIEDFKNELTLALVQDCDLVDFYVYNAYDPNCRIHAKPGKVFKQLFPDLSDSEIERFSTQYLAHMNPKYDFKLVSGKDIARYYYYENYIECSGELGESCMRNVGMSYFDLYTKNPQVQLAILVNSKDKIAARALVWDNQYYDRIYAINSVFQQQLRNQLEKLELINIWYGRTYLEYEKPVIVKLDETNFIYYPFLDSLYLLNTDTNEISNSLTIEPNSCLGSTGGGYGERNGSTCYHINNNSDLQEYFNSHSCDSCGDSCNEEYVTPDGNRLCSDCSRWCYYTEEYYHYNDVVVTYEGHYCLEDEVVRLFNGEYAYSQDSSLVEISGVYYLDNQVGISEIDNEYYDLDLLFNHTIGDTTYYCTDEQATELLSEYLQQQEEELENSSEETGIHYTKS